MGVPLTIRAVTKTFDPTAVQTPVLDTVSFDAPAGRITTILGESGCGKTTLLRIVAGLESTTSGQVLIDGTDVTTTAPAKRNVAMVFQNYGLYPAKTVAKNIEFPLRMAKVPPAERRQRALSVARTMHIDQVMDRLPSQLSGGQRQRVGICRALVRNPSILLMDEPLSNLDAKLRIELRTELVALQRAIGSTILYVTHDQTEAMTMSDLIVIMRGGRIEQLGSPAEIFAAPLTTYVAAFLGGMNLAHADSSDTIIGVRPEHFRLHGSTPPREDDFTIHGRVELAELLGTDRMLHIRSGQDIWRARVDASAPVEEEITLSARREHVHTFDATTGRRHAA